MNKNGQNITRQIQLIIVFSIILAFVYNAFSAKGISLIRREPAKIGVEDSVLFSKEIAIMDSTVKQPPISSQDTALKNGVTNNVGSSNTTASKTASGKSGYKIVTLGQVKRLLAEGKALFIDARDEPAFRKGHIRSAINIFGDEPDQHFEILAPLPRDTLTVIYCNGQDCHLARALAEFMGVLEFTNLYIYDDGWEGWQKEKMPEEQSK
jgi:rhodanese-related sulfurtransferase